MKNATYLLAALILSTASLSAATITIIDNDFKNGTYNSNGSFERDSSGDQMSGTPGTLDNQVGLWTDGDVTSLAGIDRASTFTRLWGAPSNGSFSFAAGFIDGAESSPIMNTKYVVQNGDGFNLSFDFTGYHINTLDWDTDDNLQVALFTSSDNSITGTLTQVWAGSYLDTNGDNSYESISESGIGTIVPASVGQELWIAFGAGNAGTTSTSEFAIIDSVQLTAIPEPSAYGLIAALSALGFVAVRRRR